MPADLSNSIPSDCVSLDCQRCYELSEHLRSLQKTVAPKLHFPIEWKLNRGEASLLASLYTAPDGFRTSEMLQTCAEVFSGHYGNRIVGVRIYGIRKKLRPFGIVIATRFCEGYQLMSRSIIRAALEGK